jgi:hypothetical protein
MAKNPISGSTIESTKILEEREKHSDSRKPHKWAEEIKAWADGKPIQYGFNDNWITYVNQHGISPKFNSGHYEWRVKPEPVKAKVRYRIAVVMGGPGPGVFIPYIATNDAEIESISKLGGFIKWTTPDWIEEEVEIEGEE